jgi:hypothetical protein
MIHIPGTELQISKSDCQTYRVYIKKLQYLSLGLHEARPTHKRGLQVLKNIQQ